MAARAIFSAARRTDWLETVSARCRRCASGVGVCDVSTLGKIDMQGPDAGAFLDRLYINTFSTLPVGRARYGADAARRRHRHRRRHASRLADDRYFMTTTTANAGKVMQHLEFCHQVLWPELDVQFVSVTEQWAQYSVAGPARARHAASSSIRRPISPTRPFPTWRVAECTVCGGFPARLFRISFSGELAYEIGVPARYGDALARALMEAGAPFGIAPTAPKRWA